MSYTTEHDRWLHKPGVHRSGAGSVRHGKRSIGQVAADLDLTETSLREWVRLAEIEAGEGPADALTKVEREELVRLRRDNKRLQMEREILKKAAAFFAKENE